MSETQFTWIDHQRYRIVRSVLVFSYKVDGKPLVYTAVTVEAA